MKIEKRNARAKAKAKKNSLRRHRRKQVSAARKDPDRSRRRAKVQRQAAKSHVPVVKVRGGGINLPEMTKKPEKKGFWRKVLNAFGVGKKKG